MTDIERAEEYATRECCTTCNNINHFCKEKCECWTFAKKGAEFGYNKAFVEADKNLKAIVTDFNKAKEIIKEMLSILPKENIEGVYEITEEAEEFLKEVEK